jgi:hypothetical protein
MDIVLGKKVMEQLYEEIRLQSLFVCILLNELNPSLLKAHLLLLSGNRNVSPQDLDLVRAKKYSELDHLDETLLQIILNQVKCVSRMKCNIYWSSVHKFGLMGPSIAFSEIHEYDYPKMDNLLTVRSACEDWGRVWEDIYGDIYWTFGLFGLFDYACEQHATLQIDADHSPEENSLVHVRIKRQRFEDGLLTWKYRITDSCDDVRCLSCDMLATDIILQKAKIGLHILEPYYTQHGTGEVRMRLDDDFEDLLRYMPPLFCVSFLTECLPEPVPFHERHTALHQKLSDANMECNDELCIELFNSLDRKKILFALFMTTILYKL